MASNLPPHPYLEWPAPIAFAHRGGAADNPENTMRSFGHAAELGYRYIETDVQVTADGVLLAFHDDDLVRTCDRAGVVGAMVSAEVAEARVAGTEAIPTFDEVLETWPEMRFNIDCKTDAAAEPLLACLLRHDALDRVCVASFSDARIRRLRRRAGPSLLTASAMRELTVLWATGRNVGGRAAQVPERQGRLRVVTPRFIASAHRHGMPVHVWTVDERADMERLLDLGVDGLISDRPTVLKGVLVERGAWVE